MNRNDQGALNLGPILGLSLGVNYELQKRKNGAYLDSLIRALQELASSRYVREAAFVLGQSEHMTTQCGDGSSPFTWWSNYLQHIAWKVGKCASVLFSWHSA